jgi:urease accessory protein
LIQKAALTPLAVVILTGMNRPTTPSGPGKRKAPGEGSRLEGAEIPSLTRALFTRRREGEPSLQLSATALYRLLSWLSPAFPIGAFGYSHGLETAVESGLVRDATSLRSWISGILTNGSGRIDADILCGAHRAAMAGALATLAAVNRRGLAYRATAELALESAAQGEAFLATCRAVWPDPFLEEWAAGRVRSASPDSGSPEPDTRSPEPDTRSPENKGSPASRAGAAVCYAAAVGAAAARSAIPLETALVAYLQAMATNLVSAALRLGLIGQSGGQRIVAALEPVVIRAAYDAMARGPDDFGAATVAVDLASMAHETQYTRLFRS